MGRSDRWSEEKEIEAGGVTMTDLDRAHIRLEQAKEARGLTLEQRGILSGLIASEIDGSLAGCYKDIPIQVYHHELCPGYSSTIIKRVVQQSYAHWFKERDERTQSLRFGSAFHTFCNEPHLFNSEYYVSGADSRRTKEFKADKLQAGSRIVLSAEEFSTLEVMSTKLFEHPDAKPLIESAENEITAFVQDKETGLWKRCRADIVKGRTLSDLKSTRSAELESFTRDAKKLMYGLSAAYYLQVFSELTGDLYKDFYLIACESSEPNEVAVYRVDEGSIFRGEEKIRTGLKLIRKILDDGESAWTGYTLGIKDIAI